MKDKVIDFETAKILYTKDFKELINGCYQNFESNDGKKIGDFLPMTNINNQFGELFSAPTQSLLQKWLREIHNIFIEVKLDQTSAPKFVVEIYQYSYFGNYNKVNQKDWSLYRTYEEALEKGLMEGLNLIEKK